jgi:hypothetical protein
LLGTLGDVMFQSMTSQRESRYAGMPKAGNTPVFAARRLFTSHPRKSCPVRPRHGRWAGLVAALIQALPLSVLPWAEAAEWRPTSEGTLIEEQSTEAGATAWTFSGRAFASMQTSLPSPLSEYDHGLQVDLRFKAAGDLRNAFGAWRVGLYQEDTFTGVYCLVGAGSNRGLLLYTADAMPHVFYTTASEPDVRSSTGLGSGGIEAGVPYSFSLKATPHSAELVEVTAKISDGHSAGAVTGLLPKRFVENASLLVVGSGQTEASFTVDDLRISEGSTPPKPDSGTAGAAAPRALTPSPEQQAEILDLLNTHSTAAAVLGVGAPVGNREFWDPLAATPGGRDILRKAEDYLAESWSPLDRQEFDRLLKIDRSHPDAAAQATTRHHRLGALTLAECLENRGRFLPEIGRMLDGFAAEGTWRSFQDKKNGESWGQTMQEVDLTSAMLGADIATALFWLHDRLAPDTIRRVNGALERNLIAPFRRILRGESRGHRFAWHETPSNWNSVCLYGIASAVLANPTGADDRAFLLAGITNSIEYFLAAYQEDGFYEEGADYWNYGFSRFLVVRELLSLATGGGIDLFDIPRARTAALFPFLIEMEPGIRASYSDDSPGGQMNNYVVAYTKRMLGLDYDSSWLTPERFRLGAYLYIPALFSHAHKTTSATRSRPVEIHPLRQAMPSGDLYVFRTGGRGGEMSAYIKFGHNGTQHNKNDIGTFGVSLRGGMPIFGLGAMVYSDETFGGGRYSLMVHTSEAHSVPVVGGSLQGTGEAFHAQVLERDFTDDVDRVLADLRRAYVVPDCESLTREFEYDRARDKVRVTDRVAFSRPMSFGTALVTFGSYERISENILRFTHQGAAVDVIVSTGGKPFRVSATPVPQELKIGANGLRVGIDLEQPVDSAFIELLIQPATPGSSSGD